MTNPLSALMQQEILSTPQQGPVRGTGGGLSDSVPAVVDGVEPAAISEGEFIFPADVVSMLGDGSSEAGARILSKLMDSIRSAKQNGSTDQAKSILESLGV